MKYIKICLFIYVFCPFIVFGQKPFFRISGNVKNVQVGKIYLVGIGDERSYYFKNTTLDSAEIKYGKFNFVRHIYDSLTYPYSFLITSDSVNGETGYIFISPNDQNIIIDTISRYVGPNLYSSKAQKELKECYEYVFKDIVKEAQLLEEKADLFANSQNPLNENDKEKIDEKYKEIANKADTLLFIYSKKYSNSVVSFWKLLERFSNNGYKDIYLETFNNLTTNIKSTKPAILFKKNIYKAKILALNSKFPKLELKDTLDKIVTADFTFGKFKFTLVDFWFSDCKPCLIQFASLKNIFNTFKDAELDIVGISTDSKDKFDKWLSAIRNNNLLWINYLDQDSKLAKSLLIHSFPTNFLLDENGIIIKRDITPEELLKFLNQVRLKKINFNDSSEPK